MISVNASETAAAAAAAAAGQMEAKRHHLARMGIKLAAHPPHGKSGLSAKRIDFVEVFFFFALGHDKARANAAVTLTRLICD